MERNVPDTNTARGVTVQQALVTVLWRHGALRARQIEAVNDFFFLSLRMQTLPPSHSIVAQHAHKLARDIVGMISGTEVTRVLNQLTYRLPML